RDHDVAHGQVPAPRERGPRAASALVQGNDGGQMTPAEKQEWWRRTVAALEARDPRVHVALLTALVLRHGRLVDDLGQKTRVIERVSLEELLHVTNAYAFGVR